MALAPPTLQLTTSSGSDLVHDVLDLTASTATQPDTDGQRWSPLISAASSWPPGPVPAASRQRGSQSRSITTTVTPLSSLETTPAADIIFRARRRRGNVTSATALVFAAGAAPPTSDSRRHPTTPLPTGRRRGRRTTNNKMHRLTSRGAHENR
ncbi:hypothetical protein C8Q77DRAFT_1155638 [Trametes polyzona]|nr:hypothetical protein C8Q77DRAFT_1155638 [Trametes polyzona]